MLREVSVTESGFEINDGTILIKSQQYQTLVDVSKLKEHANQHHQQLICEANAYREQQSSEGYQAGLSQAKQEHAEAMLQFEKEKQLFLSSFKADLDKFCISSLRSLIREIPDEVIVKQRLTMALEKFRSESEVTLWVNDVDYPIAEALLEALRKEEFISGQSTPLIELVVSDDLPSGDCRLETASSVLDLALEDQLAVIERSLNKK